MSDRFRSQSWRWRAGVVGSWMRVTKAGQCSSTREMRASRWYCPCVLLLMIGRSKAAMGKVFIMNYIDEIEEMSRVSKFLIHKDRVSSKLCCCYIFNQLIAAFYLNLAQCCGRSCPVNRLTTIFAHRLVARSNTRATSTNTNTNKSENVHTKTSSCCVATSTRVVARGAATPSVATATTVLLESGFG